MKTDSTFLLGELSICPNHLSITDTQGRQRIVQAKFIDVLVYLAQNYPRLVSREELIEKIWDGNAPVGEKALTNAIWHLRQQFKDAQEPMIETVRKRGYRLLIAPQYTHQTIAAKEPLAAPLGLNPVLIIMVLMIVTLCGLLIWQSSNHKTASPVIERLTTDPGRELFPSTSPDGRFVVYVWQRLNHHSDIYLKDLSNPNKAAKQLTFDSAEEVHPIFSADGHTLFYVRQSSNEQDCQITQLTLATGSTTPLAQCAQGVNVSLARSYDGRTLAFTGNSESFHHAGIYLLDLTEPGAKPKRFSCGNECRHRDRNFAFSPDGQFLAVSRRVESLVEDIFVVNLKTKAARQLTFGAKDVLGLTWHPEGEKILYAAERAGLRDGYLVDLSDGSIKNLEVPGFSFPRFMPGAQKIVFHSKQDKEHLAYLSLQEQVRGAPFPLLQSSFSYTTPHYNSQADALVFVSNESGHNEIWTSKTDGADRAQLTHMGSEVFFPRWSHNGQFIAFLAPNKNKQGNSLFVLTVKDGTVKRLNTPFDQHKRPTWSKDDSAVIAAINHDAQIRPYLFPLNTGAPETLFDADASFIIAANQRQFWFTRYFDDGLWQYDLDTQSAVKILDSNDFNVVYNWTVTAKGIYFHRRDEPHAQLNYYDFAKREIQPLLKLPSQTLSHANSLTYLPQQQMIVFNQMQFPEVDIKRLEHPLLN